MRISALVAGRLQTPRIWTMLRETLLISRVMHLFWLPPCIETMEVRPERQTLRYEKTQLCCACPSFCNAWAEQSSLKR